MDNSNFMADASGIYDRWLNYECEYESEGAARVARHQAVVGVLLDLETLARTIEQVEGATLMGAPAEMVALLRSFVAQQSAMMGESSELDVPQLYDRLCAWRRAQTVAQVSGADSAGVYCTEGGVRHRRATARVEDTYGEPKRGVIIRCDACHKSLTLAAPDPGLILSLDDVSAGDPVVRAFLCRRGHASAGAAPARVTPPPPSTPPAQPPDRTA